MALSAAMSADKQSPASQSANSRLGFKSTESIMNQNAVVIKMQLEVSVFANDDGGISIVQRNGFQENDQLIAIGVEFADALSRAIIDAKNQIMSD